MLNPGTVGKAAKQGEQMKVAPANFGINATEWDRQATIERIKQLSEEDNRRQQKAMIEHDRHLRQQMMREQMQGLNNLHNQFFGGPLNGGRKV